MHCLLYGNYIHVATRRNKQSIFEPHSAALAHLCIKKADIVQVLHQFARRANWQCALIVLKFKNQRKSAHEIVGSSPTMTFFKNLSREEKQKTVASSGFLGAASP